MDRELLIQKYFKNKLTLSEQILFDDLLQNNVDFKRELQEFKDLKLAIKSEERISLKNEFQKIDTNKKSFNWSIFYIVASFSLLLSIGSYFILKDNSLSNQELFAANFKPYGNIIHPVVRGAENLTKIEEAFVYYENGNFTTFIKTIKTTNYKNKNYDFYIANAYMAIENYNKAKIILEDYLQYNKARFTTKAYWYLGLIYLKLNDLANAKKAFLKVKNTENFKQKELKIILKNLEP